jgi:catechol 2,3-dioxygenase-like lactoylglutathione lyase family enzyme
MEQPNKTAEVNGPAKFLSFSHLSMPCRDLEESKRFYLEVLGGELVLSVPTFVYVRLAGVLIGLGSEGCSWLVPEAEYPHFAFFVGPDELLQMKCWLTKCGIPTSNFWTREGVEALMFFRDPSGNLIELYCEHGFKGAVDLPHGPPRGHGVAVDVEALRYTHWKLPDKQ